MGEGKGLEACEKMQEKKGQALPLFIVERKKRTSKKEQRKVLQGRVKPSSGAAQNNYKSQQQTHPNFGNNPFAPERDVHLRLVIRQLLQNDLLYGRFVIHRVLHVDDHNLDAL